MVHPLQLGTVKPHHNTVNEVLNIQTGKHIALHYFEVNQIARLNLCSWSAQAFQGYICEMQIHPGLSCDSVPATVLCSLNPTRGNSRADWGSPESGKHSRNVLGKWDSERMSWKNTEGIEIQFQKQFPAISPPV